MRRRDLLAHACALFGAAALGCRGRGDAAPSIASSSASGDAHARPADVRAGLQVLDWTFPDDHGDARRAVVLVPKGVPAGRKLPVLVALHGMTETQSPERGAHGWLDWYGLDAALAAIEAPPLTAADFQGLVTEGRLAAVNAELQKEPYAGVIVACPYLPSAIGGALSFDDYAAWIGGALLPRVRKETPASSEARQTGIDGVSLGGMTALEIGLKHPELFGVVGALQPAIRGIVGDVVELVAQRLAGRPLRLVTSSGDYFRDDVTSTSERLRAMGIAHEYLSTQGPHDYVWNKGPGAIEMMVWHDRVQR